MRPITHANGTNRGSLTYSAYGEVVGNTTNQADEQPLFGYAGEYHDPGTGFIYLRARHYDPTTGQFLTRDPLEMVTRDPYSYGAGNPVNRTDPTGLDSYSYTFDLGEMGTPEQLAAWTIASCSDVFPIQGCQSGFEVGDRMRLRTRVLFYTQSFPVEVTEITATSFSFVSLEGHPEGDGRSITFSFCQDDDGHNQLTISTSDSGSALVNWWGVRRGNFWLARRTWSNFASNIRLNYEYQMMDGWYGGGGLLV